MQFDELLVIVDDEILVSPVVNIRFIYTIHRYVNRAIYAALYYIHPEAKLRISLKVTKKM